MDELTNESLFVWKEMMEEFRQKWPAIKTRKRIEIHVNSLSIEEAKRISMDKFLQRENAQISRIFATKSPMTTSTPGMKSTTTMKKTGTHW